MDFTFHMPVQVFSGPGCLREHGNVLRSLGKRCLVVTGGHGAKESGALDDLLAVLSAQKIEATVFPGISPNPLLSQCRMAAYTADVCRAEFLIGVGGGSVMDATKASAWLAANASGDTERLFAGTLRRPPLPFALIGTTAGTGSEVGPAAVLTLDDTRRKKSFSHPLCYARYAFADPTYTHSMPRSTTISTALDALAHAVEGYANPACGDIPARCAETAIPLILEGLYFLQKQEGLPDAALREKLYYGALWAGLVLGALGTAYPHPLGYVLTEDHGVPHGTACAVFLPAFIRRMQQYAPERAAQLFRLAGGEEALFSMLAELAAPAIALSEEQIAGYVARWQEPPKNFARTPGGFDAEQAGELLRALFGTAPG